MNMKQRRMLLLSILCLITLVASQTDDKFRVPDEVTSNAEYYDYTGSRFAIFLEKVTYSEAKVLCKTRHGNLAELVDSKPANFLAEALAESAVGLTSLWVGGHFDDESQIYKWDSGPEIPSNNTTIYPEIEPPYWVDRPNKSPNKSMCVAMGRRGHDRPLITDLPCSTSRPFICSLPIATGNGTDPILVVPEVIGKDKTYYLYHADYTWSEALSFCREKGFRLASIEYERDYDLLAQRMLRTRPVMENAWTSGKFQDGRWKWLSNDNEISTPKSAASTSARPTDFPPWLRSEVTRSGCLLADRHVCGNLIFVEAKCNRKRNVICESIDGDANKPNLVKIGNTSLWISTIQETWRNAMNKCKTCFNPPSGKLLAFSKDATETLLSIYQGMAITLKQDIRHVWLGGHIGKGVNASDFFWVDGVNFLNPSAFTNKIEEPFRPNGGMVGGLISLCKPSKISRFNTTSFKCLNMDREDQKNFFMYGLKCDIKQHFICDAGSDTAKQTSECAFPLLRAKEGEGALVSSEATTTVSQPTEKPPETR